MTHLRPHNEWGYLWREAAYDASTTGNSGWAEHYHYLADQNDHASMREERERFDQGYARERAEVDVA